MLINSVLLKEESSKAASDFNHHSDKIAYPETTGDVSWNNKIWHSHDVERMKTDNRASLDCNAYYREEWITPKDIDVPSLVILT